MASERDLAKHINNAVLGRMIGLSDADLGKLKQICSEINEQMPDDIDHGLTEIEGLLIHFMSVTAALIGAATEFDVLPAVVLYAYYLGRMPIQEVLSTQLLSDIEANKELLKPWLKRYYSS